MMTDSAGGKMPNKSKLYAVGLLVAVFVAGIAVGTGVSAAASDRGTRRTRDGDRRQEGYAERLERELQLAPTQKDTVDQILARYQDSMTVLWGSMRPRTDSIRVAVRNDIMNALSPSQQTQYRDFIHRSDSIRASRAREGRHDRR
jgi:hypothetical protein